MLRKNDLSKSNIKKIDSHMKIINKSVYDYNEDINNFKEELEINILTEINELIAKGYTEDDAVKTSIENFGDSNHLIADINNTFNKVCYKNILKASSIGAILGFILYILNNFFISFKIYDLLNQSHTEFSRDVFKLSLLVTAISLLLFLFWEIANIIYTKRSKNFFVKILPINLIGLADLIILIRFSINGSAPLFIYDFCMLFLRLSLFSIPIFYYFIIRNKSILK